MATIRVRVTLLIKGGRKGISNHPGFGGRRVKKSLLPQIFKAEPSHATPGGEIPGNSVWEDQVLGPTSSVGDFPHALGPQHPALGCCRSSPAQLPLCSAGFVSGDGGEVRCGVASPSLGFHAWPCPAGVTV